MRSSTFVCVLLAVPALAVGQTAVVEFENSVAVYGPGIFPAITQVRQCGNFRVLVAYVNGTDLLFVDEIAPAENDSTLRVTRNFGFVEFNQYEASRSIRTIACKEPAPGSLQITGSGNDGHDNRNYEFDIMLNTTSGAYRYSDTLD